MSRTLIHVRDLRYRYTDGTEALRGVDFDLFEGETVVLLGANGSGKTTFVLHLNGLLRGEGTIEVCGLQVAPPNLTQIRRKVGLVFQDADEQLVMPTVREDVAFGLLNYGMPPGEALAKADAMLAEVGLAHAGERAPYHLSSGEKRRAAIAGVLVMEPDVIVLDEPSTYLDPPGQRDLLKLLRELPQAKIVVTHDIAMARAIGTRAVFFERGQVRESGPVDDLVSRFDWDVL